MIDAFTDRPFRGNPAAVCLVESLLTGDQMLSIAREFNLSETAFITRLGHRGAFSIRYFSPKMEIPLCGHATLAAARAVHALDGLDEVHFTTVQGLDLAARVYADRISMVLPDYDLEPATAPPALLAALGIEALRNAAYNKETKILLLEIASAPELAGLRPDFVALQRAHASINGVLVTAPSGADGYDFHSRYFWPWSGTNEDPVTGGTHTFLTRYWAVRLGKTRMRSFQSSSRSGFMDVELKDGHVVITSQAVIVLEGRMDV
ncbi:MAG TPA: PhzF family phenazine biosynthesis isomerase [Candidatus Polarisedimenticolia bacterium]|nr:PhzF family phenazine biosynthesis isomerase [Candidatus Polarisedimenticolia bacterium]